MAAKGSPAVEVEVDDRVVRVSNPDRVYFPGVGAGLTKLDVVEYFVAVGPGILAALLDRPTTLERWPGGVFEGGAAATLEDHGAVDTTARWLRADEDG